MQETIVRGNAEAPWTLLSRRLAADDGQGYPAWFQNRVRAGEENGLSGGQLRVDLL